MSLVDTHPIFLEFLEKFKEKGDMAMYYTVKIFIDKWDFFLELVEYQEIGPKELEIRLFDLCELYRQIVSLSFVLK